VIAKLTDRSNVERGINEHNVKSFLHSKYKTHENHASTDYKPTYTLY